jgi:hypothetical protein
MQDAHADAGLTDPSPGRAIWALRARFRCASVWRTPTLFHVLIRNT